MKTQTLSPSAQYDQAVARRRVAHHSALETLRAPGCQLTGLQIWRKLRLVENRVNHAALDYCNGEIDSDQWETVAQDAGRAVKRIFGWVPDGFFVNGDPRGYALKLDNEKIVLPEKIHRDMGGYGILAPVID
jgi:hypothetical protein